MEVGSTYSGIVLVNFVVLLFTRAHKDFWTQKMHAKLFFAEMIVKVFLIMYMQIKIDLKVIKYLIINHLRT